jgi:hypothetical protein
VAEKGVVAAPPPADQSSQVVYATPEQQRLLDQINSDENLRALQDERDQRTIERYTPYWNSPQYLRDLAELARRPALRASACAHARRQPRVRTRERRSSGTCRRASSSSSSGEDGQSDSSDVDPPGGGSLHPARSQARALAVGRFSR